MQFHGWIGLFCDRTGHGMHDCLDDAVYGKLVQLVQRQVHHFCKIPFKHQIFPNDATHQISDGGIDLLHERWRHVLSVR
jgi:hypothetical protein